MDINPGYAFGYSIKGMALFLDKRFPEAEVAAKKAIELDPNLGSAHIWAASALYAQGRCEQALAQDKEAFKLSPRDSDLGLWHVNIGNIEFCLGNDDTAVEEIHLGMGWDP